MVPGLFFLFIVVGGYAAFGTGEERIPPPVQIGGKVLLALLAVRWVAQRIAEWDKVRRHQHLLEQLRVLAERLPRGTLGGPGFFEGGRATVSGELDGRPLELVFRFTDPASVTYGLRLPAESIELDAFEPGFLAWLGGAGPTLVHGADAPGRELTRAIGDLVLAQRFRRVSSVGGVLRATTDFRARELDPERFAAVCRGLVLIARLLRRRTTRPLGLQAEQRCPYCRNTIAPEELLETCGECRTVHHRDCFVEARGCTVHGCAGARRRRTAAHGLKGS